MQHRLFISDKNYLLKEAQFSQKDHLLQQLVNNVKEIYLHECNPLGILDDTIRKVNEVKRFDVAFLDRFYYELSGIYRFNHGKNQLEFLFDGTPHLEKFKEDWAQTFREWTQDFCSHRHFIRAILEGAFLNPTPMAHQHIENRLKLFLEQYFGLRVYAYHGIKKIKAA